MAYILSGEEASCPNLHECFNHGTATFMILGAICTRRCPFCDVAHGKPLPPDPDEPRKLAETIQDMKLKYVVITSVDRDDLPGSWCRSFCWMCKRSARIKPWHQNSRFWFLISGDGYSSLRKIKRQSTGCVQPQLGKMFHVYIKKLIQVPIITMVFKIASWFQRNVPKHSN